MDFQVAQAVHQVVQVVRNIAHQARLVAVRAVWNIVQAVQRVRTVPAVQVANRQVARQVVARQVVAPVFKQEEDSMSVNIDIYSNSSGNTVSVSVDFAAEVRSSSFDGVSTQLEYFFKLTTGGQDTDGYGYSPRIVGDLTDLALNRQKQAATNTAVAYNNIKEMIVDYVYDYIYGHADDKFGSGVAYKAPLSI